MGGGEVTRREERRGRSAPVPGPCDSEASLMVADTVRSGRIKVGVGDVDTANDGVDY
jgi:hypothetical protein